jgi:hypothetical protein
MPSLGIARIMEVAPTYIPCQRMTRHRFQASFPVGAGIHRAEIRLQAIQRRVGHAARYLAQVLFRVTPHRTGRAPLKASGSPVTTP